MTAGQPRPDNGHDNRFVRIARDTGQGHMALAGAIIAKAIEDERAGDAAASAWLNETGARWLAMIRPDEG